MSKPKRYIDNLHEKVSRGMDVGRACEEICLELNGEADAGRGAHDYYLASCVRDLRNALDSSRMSNRAANCILELMKRKGEYSG